MVYRRHTNFAMEAIEQTLNGNPDWGKKSTCIISRNGDLVTRMYLQVVLPSVSVPAGYHFRWLDKVGHAMINNIEVEIGGSRIDRHYTDWFEIYNQLTLPTGLRGAYDKMIGNVPELTNVVAGPTTTTPNGNYTLYIPLIFWFNRNPGLALPLIALQYHEVKVNIEFNNWSDVIWTDSNSLTVPSLVDVSLWVDYVYLDSDERKRFAQASHEYLIEQVQYTGEESISSARPNIKMNYNHPAKMLVWVMQKDDLNNPTSTTSSGGTTIPTGVTQFCGMQPLNYTDQFDETKARTDTTITTAAGTLWANGGARQFWYNLDNTLMDPNSGATAVSYPVSSRALGKYTWTGGKSPIETAKIQLNGQDRFTERPGSYFDTVQPFQHFDNVPGAAGIHVYSFALKPAEHQPSGSCNMSRIDNANLQIALKTSFQQMNYTLPLQYPNVPGSYPPASSASYYGTLKLHCVNYNVLRIMSGMGEESAHNSQLPGRCHSKPFWVNSVKNGFSSGVAAC